MGNLKINNNKSSYIVVLYCSLFLKPTLNGEAATIKVIPKEAIDASILRTLDRWNSCGGRFESFAKKVGSSTLPLPKITLTTKASTATASLVSINNKTSNLDLSLEQGISTWLGIKFKDSKSPGRMYTKNVELREAKFDPMGRPCETIVYHWQSLGPALKNSDVTYSSKYGIKIISNGFAYSNEAIAKKRREFIENRATNMRYLGWNEDQVRAFEKRALDMTQTPGFFEDLVDQTVDSLKDMWRSCGGPYKKFIDTKFTTKRISSITLEPSVFHDTNYSATAWLAGTHYDNTGAIRALTMYINAYKDQGKDVYTNYDIKFIIPWEIGHSFYAQFGYDATSFETEGGSKNPCEFFKTQQLPKEWR